MRENKILRDIQLQEHRPKLRRKLVRQ
jgi:hypothetical protein